MLLSSPRDAQEALMIRRLGTLIESIHGPVYFAPEPQAAYAALGLRGYWRGYFAGRAAPLGAARAAVVTASFYNFAPAFVGRAIPAVWDLITPEQAEAVHRACQRSLAGIRDVRSCRRHPLGHPHMPPAAHARPSRLSGLAQPLV
jgi:hypothetical protein